MKNTANVYPNPFFIPKTLENFEKNELNNNSNNPNPASNLTIIVIAETPIENPTMMVMGSEILDEISENSKEHLQPQFIEL